MKKGTLNIAVAAAALMGLGATSVEAETPVVGPANNTVELRVINNNASVMRVYLQDAQGKLHQLGRVSGSDFKIIEIPGEITAKGAVQLKLFPSEPVWSLVGDADGIQTSGLSLKLGDAVNVFVEPTIERSLVEIEKN